jgi:hypothetical protein
MKEQGFDDVEDFMHSFDDAKEAAAMVKCPLCELLVADLIAVYAAKSDADGVESMIENLCSTPAQQTRLQAMYQMEKSDGGVEIARWEHDSTEALEQRLQAAADGGDDWQGDVHTVLCNSEWVPNAPDLAEAIAEGAPIDFSEETLRTDTALAPQLAKVQPRSPCHPKLALCMGSRMKCIGPQLIDRVAPVHAKDVCALRVCKAKKKKKKNGKKPKPFNRAVRRLPAPPHMWGAVRSSPHTCVRPLTGTGQAGS